MLNTIHPDDREQVARISALNITQDWNTTTYRMPKRMNLVLDARQRKVVRAEDRGRSFGDCQCLHDISETMFVQQQLSERNAALLRQNQNCIYVQ